MKEYSGKVSEIRLTYTHYGKQICTMYIEPVSTAMRIVAWERLAMWCMEHIKKGDVVVATGYEKSRSWAAADGTKHKREEFIAKKIRKNNL